MSIDHPALSPVPSAVATPLPRVLRPQRAVPADAVRPTRADVNLAHLRFNLRQLQRAAQGAAVWSVLKADGYGHGAKAVARTLERAGAAGICVALLEEGIELREAGIRVPILVMSGTFGRAAGELIRHDLTPVVYEPNQVEAIADEVRFQHADPVPVHLKIDTGMARLGALPRDVERLARTIQRQPEVELTGVMTHLACADAGSESSIHEQLDQFDAVIAILRTIGLEPAMRHAANSAGMLRTPRALLDMVRPGIAVFGVEPALGLAPQLRPVMRIHTDVVALRELEPGQTVGYGATWTAQRRSRIATVPMGYADGLSRGLSNRGHLLVRGQRAPIVGVVSMDMTMIDVTDIEGARLGDECVVLGEQKGPQGTAVITATEIAEQLGTIPWEVLTAVSRRVPRFYREP